MRLTNAEWQLMNALWAGHPATARESIEHVRYQHTPSTASSGTR